MKKKTGSQRCFTKQKPHAGRAERTEKCRFLSLVTLTFDLDLQLARAKEQIRLPCEFGANPFSGSRDISYTNNKPQADGTKNRTFRSSLRAVRTRGKA